jgi:integrase
MKEAQRIKYGSRGQGSLVKFEGVAPWMSCWYVNGVEVRESTKETDFKRARAWHKNKLDEIASQRQGHTTVLLPRVKRTTVQTLLDAYLADVRLRELKSVGHIEDHARPVSAHFGSMRACDVTAKTVDAYIERLRAAGKKNATVNRQTQILAAAFRLGLERKLVTDVPLIRKLSEKGNVRRVFYEASEIEAVLEAAPDHLKDVIRFFALTGWRKSEVVGLRWSAVDLAAGIITLPDSKNGCGRVLTISGDLVDLMKRREAARLIETTDGDVKVADYVFHKAGRPLGDFIKQWHATLTRAGLSHQEKQADGSLRTVYTRTIHDFRRTAVRNLIRAGVREKVAMDVSGHKTRSMLDRYNITSTDDIAEALEKVSAASKN